MHESTHKAYRVLRRVVGFLGISLPVVLLIGGLIWRGQLEESISHYYGTEMRDVLVGTLFVIGWFLFSYQGHDATDNRAGNLACVFALGVALFPTTSDSKAIRTVHLLSAAALFLVLAYFSLRLFTKTEKGGPSPEKRKRNKAYRASGWIILVCIALVALLYLLPTPSSIMAIKPVFWLESVTLWAFGAAWMIKGDTLWRDDHPGI